MDTRVWLFLFLYGATAIVGSLLCAWWTKFAIKRFRSITHSWYHDRTFVLSSAIALVSGGVALIDGAWGLSAILRRDEAVFIGVGLVLCLVGLLKMVWLVDLEDEPPNWHLLRLMLVMTIFWGVVAAIITPGVPFGR